MKDYEPNINGINKRIKLINLQLTAPFAPMAPELHKELDELLTERNKRLNTKFHGSKLPVFHFVKIRKGQT